MSFLVYKITHDTIDGKSYIGYTSKSVEERWKDHLECVYKSDNRHFYNAIRKYGSKCWIIEILVDGISTIEDAHYIEINMIEKYETYTKGYNSTKGGEGCTGL